MDNFHAKFLKNTKKKKKIIIKLYNKMALHPTFLQENKYFQKTFKNKNCKKHIHQSIKIMVFSIN